MLTYIPTNCSPQVSLMKLAGIIKSLILFLIPLGISLYACKKENDKSVLLPDGTYKGYFARSSPTARYKSSEVTIIFKNDSFEGIGPAAPESYPALCHGSYQLIDNKIFFRDSCNWTANFDWSYILAGTFNISRIGNQLSLTRSYPGQVTDMYLLLKQ